MPIYEYRCCCCMRCFETLLLKASDPAPACPYCGAREVERLLSAFACTSRAGGSARAEASGTCSPSGFS